MKQCSGPQKNNFSIQIYDAIRHINGSWPSLQNWFNVLRLNNGTASFAKTHPHLPLNPLPLYDITNRQSQCHLTKRFYFAKWFLLPLTPPTNYIFDSSVFQFRFSWCQDKGCQLGIKPRHIRVVEAYPISTISRRTKSPCLKFMKVLRFTLAISKKRF